ncbi:hypothetical protein G7Y89_g8737 [Cudoniella acicularis]|uniref:ABM domain-containing protein n=1 Tax=Cudoniella acicularis TaxID=354080 RepID=A0A8H4W0B5_9HELO|nr:hypothetical protein G7Y89_g8737 [Cudoniella acicularis]
MSIFFPRFGTRSGHPIQAPDPPNCTLVEFNTLEFANPVDLENEAAPVGQLWGKMIETYFSQGGVKTLWWGQRLESTQVIKLIVGWKSSDHRKDFLSSPEFSDLSQQWQSCPIPFQSSAPSLFALPSYQSYLNNVFSLPPTRSDFPDHNCISVFLTFHFSPTVDLSALASFDTQTPPRSNQQLWEHSWAIFRERALKSDGGFISSGAAEGWSEDADRDGLRPAQGKSFIGLFRFKDLETAQKFFGQEAEDDTPERNWGIGGLVELRKIAGGELAVKVEFVRMVYRKTSDPDLKSSSLPDFSFHLK